MMDGDGDSRRGGGRESKEEIKKIEPVRIKKRKKVVGEVREELEIEEEKT